jgi:hypothetical protein
MPRFWLHGHIMKVNFLVALLGLAVVTVGCVSTVGGGKTAAVPFVSDTAVAKYPRPVPQVFDAAKAVVAQRGTVSKESTLLGQTNTVRVIEGKVNQRSVWVRVESLEAGITGVSVQVRTSAGGTDKPLAYQLDKEIALKLVGQ